MKKTILLLCQVFLVTALFAQFDSETPATKYFNKTDLSACIGLGYFKTDIVNGYQKKVRNDALTFPIQTINGFIFSGRTGVGIGVGIEPWRDGLLYPVFGHIFYDFSPADNTLFASFSCGYSWGKRYATNNYHAGTGGLMLSIGIGYKLKVTKRLQFEYEAIYRYQAFESSYDVINSDSTGAIIYQRTVDYKVPCNYAGFRLGIVFH